MELDYQVDSQTGRKFVSWTVHTGLDCYTEHLSSWKFG